MKFTGLIFVMPGVKQERQAMTQAVPYLPGSC